jgi:hypothetical protein
VQSPQHAVVTLLALVNDQLMELGVPWPASDGSVVVDSDPAWLPAGADCAAVASLAPLGPGTKPANE